MNCHILLPLFAAAAVLAAPLNQNTPANTYLMDYPSVVNYPIQYGYPFRGVYEGQDLTRQNVPGFTVLAQQIAASLSNLQLYYTVKKWNTILCYLDSTCPEVVLPPTPPFGREQAYPLLVSDQLA
ncbi:uncharacterized protein LOC124314887 [Daphnia pulicaria]|uniref:uncharacterized protein LOC124314887 n=1 Tax=Daphnia pulicaria TaxID=35523 RepID=UPI001EEB9A83|nr:uncharacterized protein LOC124314887 [Daphnia pulicaria]